MDQMISIAQHSEKHRVLGYLSKMHSAGGFCLCTNIRYWLKACLCEAMALSMCHYVINYI